MRLQPLQKLSVTIGASLAIVGLFGAGAFYYASQMATADRVVERANAGMSAAFRVVVARQEGERLTKAYVVRPDSVTRAALHGAQSRVEDALDVMYRNSEDNPRQRQLLDSLGTRASKSFEAFRATMLIRDKAGVDSARHFLSHGPPSSEADTLMKLVDQMREEELRVLAEHTRLQSAHRARAQRAILVGMVLAFLLAGVALQPMRSQVAARMTSHLAREQVTDAKDRADQLQSQSAATAAQLLALHHLVAALSTARGAVPGAQALVHAAQLALRPHLVAVVVPESAGVFTVLASSDPAFDRITPDVARPIAEALRTGETAMVESRGTREGQWGTITSLDERGATGAALVVPLSRDGRAVGVLLSVLADSHVFGDDELNFAATLGRLGGPAVANRPLFN